MTKNRPVLFMNLEDCDKYSDLFDTYFTFPYLEKRTKETEMDIRDYEEIILFIPYNNKNKGEQRNKASQILSVLNNDYNNINIHSRFFQINKL